MAAHHPVMEVLRKAFVKADRGKAGGCPGGLGVESGRAGVGRSCVALVGEYESVAAFALAEAVVEEFAAEGCCDRDAAGA
jgi:hypothetical protein